MTRRLLVKMARTGTRDVGGCGVSGTACGRQVFHRPHRAGRLGGLPVTHTPGGGGGVCGNGQGRGRSGRTESGRGGRHTLSRRTPRWAWVGAAPAHDSGRHRLAVQAETKRLYEAALAGSPRGRAGVRAGSPHGRLSRTRACSNPAEGFYQAQELSIGSEVGKNAGYTVVRRLISRVANTDVLSYACTHETSAR